MEASHETFDEPALSKIEGIRAGLSKRTKGPPTAYSIKSSKKFYICYLYPIIPKPIKSY
jgi:hypothetical protein